MAYSAADDLYTTTPDTLTGEEAEASTAGDWRALQLFNLYRLLLSGFLAFSTLLDPDVFQYQNSQLFQASAFSYLIFAAATGFSISYRWFPFNSQIFVHGIADIIYIGLLIHGGEGIDSGLGMLLIVAIAGSSMVTEGRIAFFFAALASLVVLLESGLAALSHDFRTTTYAHAGILGATFFATAFLAHVMAKRIRINEALARVRGLHVQYLAQLNEQIVEHIQSGILVIDNWYRVRLSNHAAARLLGLREKAGYGTPLHQVAPNLEKLLKTWRLNPHDEVQLFQPRQGEVDVLASFTRLSQGYRTNTLIMLEDATLTSERAHQLKLASLGRLTASIAHEVRNPLGAISHAAQLLEESPDLPSADLHLVGIILKHTQRVNTVVENVLQLSRQQDTQGECFALSPWLQNFVNELSEVYELTESQIAVHIEPPELAIYFDPHQLHQVVWNLCDNALRYSKNHTPLLELRSGINPESRRPYLDVQDFGPGLNAEERAHVFEPFFTGEVAGTGLGLYIARGFCEANRAALHIADNNSTGCCFRVHFAPQIPQKGIEI